MTRLFSLIKVSVKNILSFRDGKVKQTKLRKYLPLLFIVIMIPSFGTYVYLIRELVLALLPLQQEGLAIGLLITMSGMLTFILGIFLIPSIFYFSKDIETLLSLPLKPYEILTSKLVVTILYEYLTEAILFAIVLVAYVPLVHPPFMFYLILVFVFLLLPLVPLVLDAFIIMLIMLFLPFAKNKDFFNYISGFVALAFAIGINVFSQSSMTELSQSELIAMLEAGNNSLMNLFAVSIPTLPFAVKALVDTSLVNLIIYVFISIAFFALFIVGAQLLYFKGVIGVGETGANRKNLSAKAYSKSTSRNHPIMTYAFKEMKLLIRTPIYFMNNISTILIMPVILLVAIIPNMMSENSNEFNSLFSNIRWDSSEIALFALGLGLAVGYFMSGLNLITPTAISREGSNVWFMKSIPLSYYDQALAKIYPGLIISLLGSLFLIVPVGIIIGAGLMTYIHALIGIVLAVIAMNFWGMIVDIYHPKLIWEQEAAAVKQNINAVFTMLPGFALAGGIGFLIILLSDTNNLILYGLLLSIALALAVGSVYLVHRFSASGMEKIEA